MLLPWLQRMLFSTAIKKAGKGALNKAPLEFHAPNMFVSLIAVCGINGLNFMIMIFHMDGVILPLISAGSVTAVTAFFLLRGFFCPHTHRERVVLLAALVVFFGLFVTCLFVLDIWWLALVAKLILEVTLCSAVMLVELRRVSSVQSKAVGAFMRKLKISQGSWIGKKLIKLSDSERVASDAAE